MAFFVSLPLFVFCLLFFWPSGEMEVGLPVSYLLSFISQFPSLYLFLVHCGVIPWLHISIHYVQCCPFCYLGYLPSILFQQAKFSFSTLWVDSIVWYLRTRTLELGHWPWSGQSWYVKIRDRECEPVKTACVNSHQGQGACIH